MTQERSACFRCSPMTQERSACFGCSADRHPTGEVAGWSPCASPPLSQAGAMYKFEENLNLSCLQLSQAGTLLQPNSPKRGRCARKGRIAASDGRFSPEPGLCGGAAAQRPGFGERRPFPPGNRAFSAQRPGSGEKRPFPEPGGPAKPQVRGSRFSVDLPSRDFVPAKLSRARTLRRDRARFSLSAASILPSRELVPSKSSQARTLCKMRENCCLRRSYFSRAVTLFQPNSPKRGRCASRWGELLPCRTVRPDEPWLGRGCEEARTCSILRVDPRPKRARLEQQPSQRSAPVGVVILRLAPTQGEPVAHRLHNSIGSVA